MSATHPENAQAHGHRADCNYAFGTICWHKDEQCWIAPGGERIHNRPAAYRMAQRIDREFVAKGITPIVWPSKAEREALE